MAAEVTHNEAKHRFEAKAGNDLALLEYRVSGNRITMYHTEVPQAAEGKGIAGAMAAAALEYAREQGLVVAALCSFVAHYISKHPQYADLVKER